MFEPVSITHNGEDRTIPANQVLRLIAIIEQNFNPYEVNRCAVPPGATVALFYTPILIFFGFKNIDAEALAAEFARDYEKGLAVVKFCVDMLQKLAPPKEIVELTGGAAAEGDDEAAAEGEDDNAEKKPETPAP